MCRKASPPRSRTRRHSNPGEGGRPEACEAGDSAEQPLNGWHVRILFIQAARCWLRFLGCWREPKKSTSFDPLIDDYRSWMDHERGFTPATMRKTSSYLMQFLLWYEGLGRSFSAVCLEDVDAFLASCGAGAIVASR